MRYFHPFLGRWPLRPLHSVGELHKIRDSLWSVIGWVAQLVEQRIENPRVGGSIPSPATTNTPEAEFGWVAQLVEQRIENPRVGGSIPSPATRHESLTSNDVGLFCCLTIF